MSVCSVQVGVGLTCRPLINDDMGDKIFNCILVNTLLGIIMMTINFFFYDDDHPY